MSDRPEVPENSNIEARVTHYAEQPDGDDPMNEVPFDRPEVPEPPEGYKSWLDYCVRTLDTVNSRAVERYMIACKHARAELAEKDAEIAVLKQCSACMISNICIINEEDRVVNCFECKDKVGGCTTVECGQLATLREEITDLKNLLTISEAARCRECDMAVELQEEVARLKERLGGHKAAVAISAKFALEQIQDNESELTRLRAYKEWAKEARKAIGKIEFDAVVRWDNNRWLKLMSRFDTLEKEGDSRETPEN